MTRSASSKLFLHAYALDFIYKKSQLKVIRHLLRLYDIQVVENTSKFQARAGILPIFKEPDPILNRGKSFVEGFGIEKSDTTYYEVL